MADPDSDGVALPDVHVDGLRFTPWPPARRGVSDEPKRLVERSEPLSFLQPADGAVDLLTLCTVAWALLISRHSQTDDVVFGVALDQEQIIAVRFAIDVSKPTISDALSSAPKLKTGRRTSQRDADISTTVDSQSVKQSQDDLPNLLVVLSESGTASTKPLDSGSHISPSCPLTIVCNLSPKHVTPELYYDGGALDSDEAKRFLRQYGHVFHQLVHLDPQRPLLEIWLPSLDEQSQLEAWSGRTIAPVEQCIHQMFQDRVRVHPDAQAVDGWDGSFTYAELNDMVIPLAALLQDQGVCPDTIVPICLEKSAWTVVAMMAVLRAGGAVMCLDPSTPETRLADMLAKADSRSHSILCSKAQAELCQRLAPGSNIIVDAESLAQLPQPTTSLPETARPDNLAIVQHTSGSTGTPKGILLTHSAYCTSASVHGPATNMGCGSRVYQFASYSFDLCLVEILTALLMGSCICIPADDEKTDRLAESITARRATWMVSTPSVLRLFSPKEVPTLETIAFGGELVTADLLETWAPHLRFVQMYGPSECAVFCTTAPIKHPGQSPTNIGRALGCRTWVTEPDDVTLLAPIGCVGELVISGPLLAKGYLNLPQESSSAFPPAPAWLKADPGSERVYRTGDLVRYNSDGTLSFVGRRHRANQIKHRGQRIELADVESNLIRHRNVKNCVVLYPSKGAYAQRIVAIIEMHHTAGRHAFGAGEMSEHLDSVRVFAEQRLSAYMVPTTWFYSPSLPVNRSTKIDRMLLLRELDSLEHYQSDTRPNGDDHDPTPVAQEHLTKTITQNLHEAVAEVLNLEISRVSLGHSFIQNGGDSLSAMRLIGRCRKTGVHVATGQVLSADSLNQLVRLAAQEETTQPAPKVDGTAVGGSTPRIASLELVTAARKAYPKLFEGIPPRVDNVYPCTPMQEAMLLSQARVEGHYMTAHTFEISTDIKVSVAQLRNAWNAVVRRHQALRTVFIELPTDFGAFAQVILSEAPADIEVLSHASEMSGKPRLALLGTDLPHRFGMAHDSQRGVWHCKLEMSHVVADGVSMQIMLEELALACEDKLSSEPGPLYGEYSSFLLQQKTDDWINWWARHLENIAPCHLKLPQPSLPMTASLECLGIDIEVEERSRKALEARNLSMATLIHAAWALLLSSYTAQEEICFAYVTAGRDIPVAGVAEMVGTLINTLISRLRIDRKARVVEILRTIKEDYMQGSKRQHAPMSSVMHKLTSSESRLFNSLLSVVHDWNLEKPRGTSLTFSEFQVWSPTEYDITVTALLSKNNVRVQMDYWTSTFSGCAVRGIGETFRAIIRSLLQNLNAEINALDILSDLDKAQTRLWNAQPISKTAVCVHELVSTQAIVRPDAAAICSWDGDFTYRHLDEASDCFASILQHNGCGPENLVPICLERSLWVAVAMLSVLKSGAGFVLLDPAHPTERLADIVEQVNAQLVMVSEATSNLWSATALSSFECSAKAYVRLRGSARPPKPLRLSAPDNSCYVIFTSGTTGRPKGIVTEHGAYCSSALPRAGAIRRDQDSRHFQYSSYSFDMCIEDILTTLMVGGCVCIPSEEERMNDIAGAMRRMRVNSAELTPSVARMLSPEDVPSLRVLMLGGERVSAADVERWTSASDLHLINAYGPSECSVTSVVHQRSHDDDLPANTIGKGAGATVWVVNPYDHNHLAPIGAVGELLIDGPGLARGYLGDAAKTDAAFVPCPAWLGHTDSSRRFYKTGDLVQQCGDGSLIYLGRADTQIKRYGQRIELAEIDSVVAAAIPWSSAVVSVLATPELRPGNPSLAVFFTVDEIGPSGDNSNVLSLSEPLSHSLLLVQDNVSRILPSFMIPGLYLPMSKLPTTLSGKVDRKCLAGLVQTLSQSQLLEHSLQAASSVKPTTPMELKLQSLWSRILKLPADEIGADQSWSRLGGDSFRTMQLAALARSEGLSLSVATIFRNPILSDLARIAAIVDDAVSTRDFDTVPPPFTLLSSPDELPGFFDVLKHEYSIERDQVEDAYPCTALQEGLMALSMRKKTAYCTQLVYPLDRHVSIDGLRSACAKVVSNQAILRTRLVFTRDLGSIQVVMKKADTESAPELCCVADSFSAYLEADKQKPMQYGAELSRFAIAFRDGELYFVWTAHHCVYDGYMTDMVLDSIVSAYNNEPLHVTPPFSCFIGYLQQHQEGDEDYWKEQCQGFQPVDFPARAVGSDAERADRSDTYHLPISQTNRSDHSMPTIIRAAWAMCIAAYSDSSDVAFGVTLLGRSAPVKGITDMVGPTLTSVPVRVRLDQDQSLASYLDAIQDQSLNMMPFEHLGLQNIRKLSTDCRHACEFQNLLVIQPGGTQDKRIGLFGPQESTEASFLGFHTYPLVLGCAIHPEELTLTFSFDANAISSTQVERLSHHFQHVVSQMRAADSSICLQKIDMFSVYDMEKLTYWNAEIPTEQNVLIHEEIEQRTVLQPDAEAVYAWDRSLSYKQLDALSTQLANFLARQDLAAPDALIPLLFEKSSWVPVVMLAVLKAGSGFVPLDPSHPQERLREIIRQCGAPVVLVSPANANLVDLTTTTALEISEDFFQASENDQTRFFKASSSPDFGHSNGHLEKPIKSALTDTYDRAPSTRSSNDGTSAARRKVQSHNIAYVIFTSGSTGKPKGVMIEHRQFCSGVIGPRQAALVRSEKSRVLQFASLSFDTSLEDIITTLLFGGCVCIPSESDRMNNIAAFISKSQANTAHITPSFANTLSPDTVPTLKFIRLGGEGMTQGHIDTWAEAVDLRNVYGPTETAITATCSSEVTLTSNYANIGRGVAARIWITQADDPDRLTPLGLVGEMLVEGPLLARGYLADEGKTSRSFMVNPAWASPIDSSQQRRFYRTGDLCRYDESGNIIYVGRSDAQVKIYGQRVEIGEIEYQLQKALDNIYDVAVEAITQSADESRKILVGFICIGNLFEGDQTDLSTLPKSTLKNFRTVTMELDAKLSLSLPKYMIPSRFVPLRTLPTLISGKADRKQLRAILSRLSLEQLQAFSLADGLKRQPQTERELTLQHQWASVLQIKPQRIGLEDNFLRLGGDSITAIKLASLLRDGGVAISVADIFSSPNLSHMLRHIENLASNGSRIDRPAIHPFSLLEEETVSVMFETLERQGISRKKVQDAYPCTPLQEGLLSLSMQNRQAYLSHTIYHLPRTTQVDRFKDAWNQVIRRNKILRTKMVNLSGYGTVQAVLDEYPTWWEGCNHLAHIRRITEIFDLEKDLAHYALCNGVDDGEERPLVFVLTMHHALYDGFSFAEMLRQVDAAYAGTYDLTSQPGDFATFIQHLHQVSGPDCEAFWSSKLLDCAETSDLPVRTRDAVRNLRAMADVNISIPYKLPAGVNITPSILLRAAWAIVISTYAGSYDVVFGASVTGRMTDIHGIDTIVGPTLATIPIRVMLKPDMLIMELLESLVSDMIAATKFEHIGLQNIKRLNKDTQRCCDFSSLLVIRTPPDPFPSESLFADRQNDIDAQKNDDPYPVDLECLAKKDVFEIEARFDSSLVPHSQMIRILQTLGQVINELCSDPSKRISDIQVVSKRDLEEMDTFNKSMSETQHITVQDALEKRLKCNTRAQALYTDAHNFSYGDLNSFTCRLAQYLSKVGVEAGDFIPLVFEKSAWHAICMLGVIRAGCTFVPLDPDHLPESRLRDIVAQCHATVILTSVNLAAELPDLDGVTKVKVSASFFAELRKNAGPMSLRRASPDGILYTIFTSGTTGKPKGVMISHKAFMSVFQAKVSYMDVSERTRALQFVSHGFDVSISDILLTLLQGGCVCVPNSRFDGLEDFIVRADVNSATLTPSLCTALDATRVTKHLKILRLIGERVTDAHVQKWVHSVDLQILYGPTEACDVVAATPYLTPHYRNAANIGSPIGTRLWLVHRDNHERLVPIGAVGELCIQGPGLADGYLDDCDRTSAAFVHAPQWAQLKHSTNENRRLYKTGDLVKYEDSTIVYVGRKDSQVKLRGLRLELGEIEHHLSQINVLKAAGAVVGVVNPASSSAEMLVAFIPRKPAGSDYNELLAIISAALAQNVPPYMIPSAILPVDEIPLSANGKADRRRLGSIANETTLDNFFTGRARAQFKMPTTPMELRMQQLWASALRLDLSCIGCTENFFALGGDSVIVMRTVSAAKSCGIAIKAKDFFVGQTLEKVASMATTAEPDQSSNQRPAAQPILSDKAIDHICRILTIEANDIEKIVEGTDFQSWCISHSSLESRGCLNYFTFKPEGILDLPRLRQACLLLIARHEVLRTRFVAHQRKLLQIVMKFKQDDWPIMSSKSEPHMGNHALELRSPAMSEQDPAVQLYLDESRTELTLRLSHAQYDGLSLPVLYEDLSRLYAGKTLQPAPAFCDYVRASQSNVNTETINYWRAFLRDSYVTALVDHQAPSCRNIQNCSKVQTIPAIDTAVSKATAATIVKAAWAMVLSRVTQSKDVVFGSLVHTRNVDLDGVEDIVGPCLNFVPVRAQVHENGSADKLIQQIQDQHIQSLSHAMMGFNDVIRQCTDWPVWTRYSSIVQYQNLDGSIEDMTLGESRCNVDALAPDSDWSDVWIIVTPKGLELEVLLKYCSSSIAETLATALLTELCCDITQLAGSELGQLTLFKPASRKPLSDQPKFPLVAPASPVPQGSILTSAKPEYTSQASAIVLAAWNQVLGDSSRRDCPFYSIWGDLVAASQLAALYATAGATNVTTETVIENPTISAQIEIIALSLSKA